MANAGIHHLSMADTKDKDVVELNGRIIESSQELN